MLLSLIEKLDRKVFKPIVIVPKKGQLSQKLQAMNVATYFLSLPPYSFRTLFVPGISPIAIFQFFKLTRKIKPDLIHLNHLTLSIYAAVAAKLLKIPLIATAHGPWDSYYFYQDFVTQLFVNKVLANTPQTAQNLLKRKIVASNKIEVIPPGIDTKIFKPTDASGKAKARKQLGLPPKNLIVAIVGRLDPVKDHITFLKASKLVNRKLPSVIFFIVGSNLGDFSGRKNQYLDQIKNYLGENQELSKNVIFGGYISSMPAVYQASDLLISTSSSESFGIALAEGAASSIPIITTGTSRKHLIVQNNKSGILIPPKNPQILAQKILFLANNRQLRQKFGAEGRNLIVKNFNIRNYVQNIENNYLKLQKISLSAKNRNH